MVLGGIALAGILWMNVQHRVIPSTSLAIEAGRWDLVLQKARQVDLNQATAVELERLPHVGPGLARRIVEYRSRRGAFQSAEELMHVSGIGPKTFAAIRDRVTIGE